MSRRPKRGRKLSWKLRRKEEAKKIREVRNKLDERPKPEADWIWSPLANSGGRMGVKRIAWLTH